jgi:hypothetical protein
MSMRNTELGLSPHVSQWMVQAITRLVATYAIVQGLLIIIGGRHRWSAPSFSTAMTVPGAPASWGVALLVFGVLTLGGTFILTSLGTKLVAVGTSGTSAWCVFFAGSLAVAAWHNPQASTMGVLTYVLFAVMAASLAVAYLHSEH